MTRKHSSLISFFGSLCIATALLAIAFASRPVHAFSAWVLEGSSLDKKRPAHILVTGYSHGMGDQFVQSAAARMLRYRELHPDRTIVLFQPRVESFPLKGLQRVVNNDRELLGETLVKELLDFAQIQTLDFFSHSSAHQGVGIETGDVTMPEQSFYAVGLSANPVSKYRKGTPGIEKLRKVLAPDAWITINGCNSGWIQAPALSKILNRPVLAAATATDFQRLRDDGVYYFNNEGQFPSSGQWAKTNTLAYESETSCSRGACLRMKPQAGPYEGFWGDYSNVGGLGYYKFFCNYEGFERNCYQVMARYLQVALSQKVLRGSSLRADYLETIYDLLCPISPTKPKRADCIAALNQKLASGEESYNPYPGTPADCDLKGCKIKALDCTFTSSGWATPGTCRFTRDPKADGSKTLIREVKNYLRGLDELGIH